jgi:GntR family transcriptional regulator, transcriptional repressor for pyruvate dehydrogenase complex
MLKPIKPKRISDQIFEQLRDLIYRGHFQPGERLMTEREIADTLGVSRPTVREAINKLVTMGILVHRQGQGTFVTLPGDGSSKNPLAAAMHDEDVSLRELLEVRLWLECNAAALAARRATEEDIVALEKSLHEMISEIDKGGLGHHADVSFHMAISYASKNTVQVHIMKNLYDLIFYGIKENLQRLYSEPGNLPKIAKQHTEIFESIRGHEPETAYEAMKRHIAFVLDFFKERSLA